MSQVHLWFLVDDPAQAVEYRLHHRGSARPAAPRRIAATQAPRHDYTDDFAASGLILTGATAEEVREKLRARGFQRHEGVIATGALLIDGRPVSECWMHTSDIEAMERIRRRMADDMARGPRGLRGMS